jgi:MurNAc alpha-1-phosphate uridylyltransferase
MKLPIAVLAGGLATRLRPLTEKIPKSLIIVNDTPFVLHQLRLFQQYEIHHVHFCLGYLGEKIKNVIDKSIFSKTMKITYSFDGEKLMGTGGALKKALQELPDAFFVSYGDSFLNIDYRSVESRFFEFDKKEYGLMTVYKNSNKYDTSNVIYKNNRILMYSKKHLTVEMKYIDYGVGVLRKSHFSGFSDQTHFDLSEIYEKLSIEGNLLGYESFERFYEIGSVKGIEDLSDYLKK